MRAALPTAVRAAVAAATLGLASCGDPPAVGPEIVEVQQLPVAGLSTVEEVPATPLQVTLDPNPALVDANTAASAGVDLGTAAGIAYRDVGARFQDAITPVRALRVFVDRVVPPDLAEGFVWDVYRGDDNLIWTQVALDGPVSFDPDLLRFEIPIPRTQARFLKAVTKPLPSSASSEPAYREIFVTELQLFDREPALGAR